LSKNLVNQQLTKGARKSIAPLVFKKPFQIKDLTLGRNGFHIPSYTQLPFAQHNQHPPVATIPTMTATPPTPKTGQTWHLPASGNTITITSKGRDGELRCTYVAYGNDPLLGGAEAFGSTCLLSAEFLQKHGVLSDE
jgi:hypothetical protein